MLPSPRFGLNMHVCHDSTTEADAIPADADVLQGLVAVHMHAHAYMNAPGQLRSAHTPRSFLPPARRLHTEASVIAAIAKHNQTWRVPIVVFPQKAAQRKVGTHSCRHSH